MKNKFIFFLNLFVGVGAFLFLFGLFLVGGFKHGFLFSFRLIPVSLPLCGMIYLVLYFCAWVHYRLLVVFLGRKAKEIQLDTVRFGTLGYIGVAEVFILATLPHINSTYSLIVIYFPPLAFVSFIIIFAIAKILGLRPSANPTEKSDEAAEVKAKSSV